MLWATLPSPRPYDALCHHLRTGRPATFPPGSGGGVRLGALLGEAPEVCFRKANTADVP